MATEKTVYTHDGKEIQLVVEQEPSGLYVVRATNEPVENQQTLACVLGAGRTRDGAVADAVDTIEWLHDTLQGPPPGVADAKAV